MKNKLDKEQRDCLIFIMKNMLIRDIFKVVKETHDELPWKKPWIEENKKYETISADYIQEFCKEIRDENTNHWINDN